MIVQLLVALGLTVVTVLLHALGTFEAIWHVSRLQQTGTSQPRLLAREVQVVRVVSLLLLLHLAESAVWALYYFAASLLADVETAFYFSLTSYTTLGYGDVVLPPRARILGPIEGAVGILTFGWSTAIMVAAIPRIYQNRLHPRPDLPLDRGPIGLDL
jgi:hypothetical protein